MPDQTRPPEHDYTTASLVMGGVNLFCVLVVIWAGLGLFTVLMLVFVLDWLIDRMAEAKADDTPARPLK